MSFPKRLIGKKRGMLEIFSEDGNSVPVTVIELFPLTVTQIKGKQNDGYNAIQVGVIPAKVKHLTRAEQQHLQKNNLPLFRKLKEIRTSVDEVGNFQVGDTIQPLDEQSFLRPGAVIHVTGHSIGKGFQGNTKRWNHGRGPMSHGSKSHRLPGSIGAGTTPGRVFKGLQMAGKMGNEQVTVRNLKVVKILPDWNVVLVKGSVPGVEGGLLYLKEKPLRWNASNQ